MWLRGRRSQSPLLVVALVLALAAAATLKGARAADEDPLQDFCVGNGTVPLSGNRNNGFPCKLASEVTGSDFKFTSLKNFQDASGTEFGMVFTPGSVHFFPGVNTLGVSITRIDLAVGGINPPHLHPRATEVLYVVQGTLEVAFVAGNSNTAYKETLGSGEVFVFPRALVHYQKNLGEVPAVAIAFFNAQNAGSYNLPTSLKAFPEDLLYSSFKNLLNSSSPSSSR